MYSEKTLYKLDRFTEELRYDDEPESEIKYARELLESYPDLEYISDGIHTYAFRSNDVMVCASSLLDSMKIIYSTMQDEHLPEITVLYVGETFAIYEMLFYNVVHGTKRLNPVQKKLYDLFYEIDKNFRWVDSFIFSDEFEALPESLQATFNKLVGHINEKVIFDFAPWNIAWKGDTLILLDIFLVLRD